MSKVSALMVLGTRPEAIKLAPVIRRCTSDSLVQPIVCSTGQHREMLAQVLDYFAIMPDVSLEVMRPDQTLSGLTARLMEALQTTVSAHRPDCIVAQGDTTSVLTAAMVAFYNRLPFVHVEAGLRTGDLLAPWPEEYNRRVAGITAEVHCAPTRGAAENLLREGIPAHRVHVTGNTVIDALFWARDRERARGEKWDAIYRLLTGRRFVLITGHRRENFGDGFRQVCDAVAELAHAFPDVSFVYPVHLNPNVQQPVHQILGAIENVHLRPPASYPEFIWLMDRCTIIVTDSGGVQEEAPSLGKPVLVTRSVTERPEAVAAGTVKLVGTDRERIVSEVTLLLTDEAAYRQRQASENPYGDGRAAHRIVELIASRAWEQKTPAIRKAA